MKGEESLYLSRLIQNYSNKDSVVLVGDTRDQWNRRENPEINPCIYGQLTYNKGDKNIKQIKVSSINGTGKSGQPHAKE